MVKPKGSSRTTEPQYPSVRNVSVGRVIGSSVCTFTCCLPRPLRLRLSVAVPRFDSRVSALPASNAFLMYGGLIKFRHIAVLLLLLHFALATVVSSFSYLEV
jgi:hypothetical protein